MEPSVTEEGADAIAKAVSALESIIQKEMPDITAERYIGHCSAYLKDILRTHSEKSKRRSASS